MRFRHLIAAALMLQVALLLSAAAFEVRQTRFGRVTNLQIRDDLPEDDWQVDFFGEKPSLKPESTERFAVMTVVPASGKSIGKYDYTLDGRKCQAMAVSLDKFRPDTWEYVQPQGASKAVKLLYIVSADEGRYDFPLRFQYAIGSVPREERKITLSLRDKPVAVPEVPVGDGETPGEGADDAPPAEGDPDAGDGGTEPVGGAEDGDAGGGDPEVADNGDPANGAPEQDKPDKPTEKPAEKPAEDNDGPGMFDPDAWD